MKCATVSGLIFPQQGLCDVRNTQHIKAIPYKIEGKSSIVGHVPIMRERKAKEHKRNLDQLTKLALSVETCEGSRGITLSLSCDFLAHTSTQHDAYHPFAWLQLNVEQSERTK